MAFVFLGTLFVFSVFKRRNTTLEILLDQYRAERTKLYSVVKQLYFENRELTARISALEKAMNVQYSTVETQVSPSSSFTEDSSEASLSSRTHKKQLWPFNIIT